MDGLKKRLSESVQLKLSFTLSLAILVVAIVAGVFSFLAAFNEAHELQDDVLRQVAQLMDRQRLSPAPSGIDTRPKDSDEESRVIVQRLGNSNSPSVTVDAGGIFPLPTTLDDGLHTLEFGGETFRVLVKTMAAGERIAVSQESGFRNEIARDSALRTVMPFLILVPALLLIVADLVSALRIRTGVKSALVRSAVSRAMPSTSPGNMRSRITTAQHPPCSRRWASLRPLDVDYVRYEPCRLIRLPLPTVSDARARRAAPPISGAAIDS